MHDDRAAQPLFLADQHLELPIVHRGTQRGAEGGVALACGRRAQRLQDADRNVVRIEMLGAHEAQVGCRRPEGGQGSSQEVCGVMRGCAGVFGKTTRRLLP